MGFGWGETAGWVDGFEGGAKKIGLPWMSAVPPQLPLAGMALPVSNPLVTYRPSLDRLERQFTSPLNVSSRPRAATERSGKDAQLNHHRRTLGASSARFRYAKISGNFFFQPSQIS